MSKICACLKLHTGKNGKCNHTSAVIVSYLEKDPRDKEKDRGTEKRWAIWNVHQFKTGK